MGSIRWIENEKLIGQGGEGKRAACGLAGGKSWDEQRNTASHDSR